MEGCSPLAEICAHSTTRASSFQVGGGTARQQTSKTIPKRMTPAHWAEAQMQHPRSELDYLAV